MNKIEEVESISDTTMFSTNLTPGLNLPFFDQIHYLKQGKMQKG